MKYSYEQLNIKFVEPRKVSLSTKLVSIVLSLVLVSIPLAELVREFDYNRIESVPVVNCIADYHLYYQPLEFKEFKPKE